MDIMDIMDIIMAIIIIIIIITATATIVADIMIVGVDAVATTHMIVTTITDTPHTCIGKG